MIERHRAIASEPTSSNSSMPRRIRKKIEFDAKAHNFEKFEILTSAEIEIEARNGVKPRGILAHVAFTPRMYVQTSTIRIEFGVRRAVLSIESLNGSISKLNDWSVLNQEKNIYYVRLRDASEAVTLCIDPSSENYTLEELPLPPSAGENRFFKFAYAASSTSCEELTAKLTIDLSSEGLYIFGDPQNKPSVALMKKVAAITSIAIEKEASASSGKIERIIPIKERER